MAASSFLPWGLATTPVWRLRIPVCRWNETWPYGRPPAAVAWRRFKLSRNSRERQYIGVDETCLLTQSCLSAAERELSGAGVGWLLRQALDADRRRFAAVTRRSLALFITSITAVTDHRFVDRSLYNNTQQTHFRSSEQMFNSAWRRSFFMFIVIQHNGSNE